MWPFNRKGKEARTAGPPDVTLAEWLGGGGITKEDALGVPAVQACIGLVAGIVTTLPIRLYDCGGGKKEPCPGDYRLALLNDDPKDALDAPQFWRALVTDHYLGKGGYAYVNRDGNRIASLHYVDERHVAAMEGHDPIFKHSALMVMGKRLESFDFIKVLRGTANGAAGRSLMQEAPLAFGTMLAAMKLERKLMESGGGKLGVFKPSSDASRVSLDELKAQLRAMLDSRSTYGAVNQSVEFMSLAASPAELQMRENKAANAAEICKLFGLPPDLVAGAPGTAANMGRLFTLAMRTGVLPVLRAIESALDRVMLLESEKGRLRFGFDYMELMKGTGEERAAYFRAALESGYMTINEVRRMEGLPDYDLDLAHFSLADSLLNLGNGTFYTPNTGSAYNMATGEFTPGGGKGKGGAG